MGLDQYAFARDAQLRPNRPIDFDNNDADKLIFQWRKHANLQGWMEALYRQKGGLQEDFNCTPVLIEAEDLDALEAAVRDDNLPQTTGFFFGESRPEDRDDDLRFIGLAREELKAGRILYYDSWW